MALINDNRGERERGWLGVYFSEKKPQKLATRPLEFKRGIQQVLGLVGNCVLSFITLNGKGWRSSIGASLWAMVREELKIQIADR